MHKTSLVRHFIKISRFHNGNLVLYYSRPPLRSPPPPNTAAHFQVPKKCLMKKLSFYFVIRTVTDQIVSASFQFSTAQLIQCAHPLTAGFRIPPLFRQTRNRRYWEGRLFMLCIIIYVANILKTLILF